MFRRNYASAAAATSEESSSPTQISESSNPPITSTAVDPNIVVKAGIIVSRPPLVTPTPHPFESAYHLYQRRLNERLALPFMQYFYYKRGTPAFEIWRSHRKERGGVAARDIGQYNPYDKEGWNDEIVIGQDDPSKQEYIVSTLIKEEGRGSEFAGENAKDDVVNMGGLRRITKADEKNDQRSLERALSRTLYLLVKQKQQKSKSKKADEEAERQLWRLPRGDLVEKEGLKEAAQRILTSRCGPNMNTWFVGNHPVGHYIEPLQSDNSTPSLSSSEDNTTSSSALLNATKTFYMKARIMAGQADIQKSQSQETTTDQAKSSSADRDADEVEDFKWLSKDEIEKTVDLGYWLKIRNMLVEQ